MVIVEAREEALSHLPNSQFDCAALKKWKMFVFLY